MLVKQRLVYLFLLPLWLLRGKAYLKTQISERVELNAAALPYRDDVIEWLKEEDAPQAAGSSWRPGPNFKLAQAVAKHLGVFDEVIATTQTVNLVGHRKRDAFVERFGCRLLRLRG